MVGQVRSNGESYVTPIGEREETEGGLQVIATVRGGWHQSLSGSRLLYDAKRSDPDTTEPDADRRLGSERQPASLGELYDAQATTLWYAIGMLEECIETMNEALETYSDENLIASDVIVMRFQVRLRDLYRSVLGIGSGARAIVAGIINVFSNQQGAPLNHAQLTGLRDALAAIKDGPFLSQMDGLTVLDAIDRSGLSTRAAWISEAVEALEGEDQEQP